MTPTSEQRAAAEAFAHNRLLKITAFAGAGKTTTLQLIANTKTEHGLYLAFNKTIARHAQTRFNPRVECLTTHSLAWKAMKNQFDFSTGKMQSRLSPAALADMLQLKEFKISSTLSLTPIQHAHLLQRTVARFCQSADDDITTDHVPSYTRLDGLPPPLLKATKDYAVKHAKDLWQRMTAPHDAIPLGHDGYLKLFALSKPQLPYAYILLDEAQDTNPVVLSLLNDQQCQMGFVGDRHQQIYEWRGGINAMESITDAADTYLTQSFRFGPTLAEHASLLLATLGERHTLRGNPAVETSLSNDMDAPVDCILARTNARVITEIIFALEARTKPFVLGGVFDIKRMLYDVTALRNSRAAQSPELFGFANWAQVAEFAQTEEGEDLAAFVSLVNQHGEGALISALSKTAHTAFDARLTIGTAHKSKGCEWGRVRLCQDLHKHQNPKTGQTNKASVRLLYVAMTRAQHSLTAAPEMLKIATAEDTTYSSPASSIGDTK